MNLRPAFLLCGIVAIGVLLGSGTMGCVTVSRFNELEQRVIALERQKTELAEELRQEQERMQRLYTDFNTATDSFRKGGANIMADLDAIKSDVARLKGGNEEQLYKLGRAQEDLDLVKAALDEKFGMALVQLPKGLGEDADALYTAGKSAFDRNDLPMARGILRKFLEIRPDDARAPNALYLIGDSYFREGRYGQSIREMQRLHDRYRDVKGAPVEKALLRIAESLLKQDDCRKAAGVLKYLSDYNRKAPEAEKARDMLKELKGRCKGI